MKQNFKFIRSSVLIAKQPVKMYKKKYVKKMQWLQKVKIIVIYSQDIIWDDNTLYLSLFHPLLIHYTQFRYFSEIHLLYVFILHKVNF